MIHAQPFPDNIHHLLTAGRAIRFQWSLSRAATAHIANRLRLPAEAREIVNASLTNAVQTEPADT